MFRPSNSTLLSTTILLLSGAAQVHAHVGAWARGIWECTDGTKEDNNESSKPLYMRPKFGTNGWWFHGQTCIDHRPPLDKFLELPAGGQFTVEMSGNRAFTTLSYGGKLIKEFGDNRNEPQRQINGSQCITTPNLHAVSEADAAGYAFAISYQNDIKKVTLDNLVVFTTKYNTPYKRIATFDVPADLPECPPGGCICAALWIPNHCGEPNEYMIGYNCKVTHVKPTARALAPAKTPVWCEDDPNKCIKGAKGMIVFNQLEGNNINIDGYQKDRMTKSPGYNMKTGFADGAQNNIFVDVAPQIALTKNTTTSSAQSPATSSGDSSSCRRQDTGKSRMV